MMECKERGRLFDLIYQTSKQRLAGIPLKAQLQLIGHARDGGGGTKWKRDDYF